MVIYRFKVCGRGQFPLDMLRYDACWPSSKNDALALEYSIENRKTREVDLSSIMEPTIERWASFMWKVTHINGRRI